MFKIIPYTNYYDSFYGANISQGCLRSGPRPCKSGEPPCGVDEDQSNRSSQDIYLRPNETIMIIAPEGISFELRTNRAYFPDTVVGRFSNGSIFSTSLFDRYYRGFYIANPIGVNNNFTVCFQYI